MAIQIIKANPNFKKRVPKGVPYLDVAEFFYDTIQGEGVNIGVPAAFLRMQHCSLSCSWCDTKEVWRHGNPYTFDELFEMMLGCNIIGKLKGGQHLILTGGSPLKQQENLSLFIVEFVKRYDFLPIIEIENECTIMPTQLMKGFVLIWNNSPKLSNSGIHTHIRYQSEILKELAAMENSWFKFVVSKEEDWEEIEQFYLNNKRIHRQQVILMPQGVTRNELEQNREFVIDLAIRKGVRYCTREHIVIWDKKTGV